MFEIKYTIFPDDIIELRKMDLNSFEKEFSDVYGTFTLIINGKRYLPYPETFDVPIDALRIYSELIVNHLESLSEAVKTLEFASFVAIKYVENSWTWLEFRRNNDLLAIREIAIEIEDTDGLINTNEVQFRYSKHFPKDHVQGVIFMSDFTKEVYSKVCLFLDDVEKINPLLFDSFMFLKLKSFVSEYHLGKD